MHKIECFPENNRRQIMHSMHKYTITFCNRVLIMITIIFLVAVSKTRSSSFDLSPNRRNARVAVFYQSTNVNIAKRKKITHYL